MPSGRVERLKEALSAALAGLSRERTYGEALAALAQGLFLWRFELNAGPEELAAWGGPFAVPAWCGRAPEAVRALQAELTEVNPSDEELGLALEALHWECGGEKNKERGAFYTPPQPARFMARLALRLYFQELAQPRSSGRQPGAPVRLPPDFYLADPAVGAGAFLAAALTELAALPADLRGGRSALEILSCLAGRDRDPEAVYLTRVRLWLLVAEEVARRRSFPPLAAVRTGDSLREEPEPADIILENPPYLRQESLSAEEKDMLAARFGRVVPRQSDLYAYFLANLKNELKPGGVAVLVTPVAWLEVDYGRALQEELLRNFEIPLIITSACERWFSRAAVHTAVSAFIRPEEAGRRLRPRRPTALVSLSRPLAVAAEEIVATGGRFPAGWSAGETFRAVSVPRTELATLTRRQRPVRARWGTLLRAPGAYFALHAAAPDAWVSAGEVAEVTRGFTSGANAFFFVRDVTAEADPRVLAELGVTPGSGLRAIAARGGRRCFAVEDRFLFPLIKSPREVAGYTIREEELTWRVLLLPPDEEYVRNLRVAEYIRWGEKEGFGRRSTTRSRTFWWSLPKLLPPQVLARQFYDRRFNFPYNPGAALCDHTFYYLTGCADPELFAALLNSTLTYFHVELWGRSNMGDGVLTFYGPELSDLPLPRPELFAGERAGELKRLFRRLSARAVLPIEEEVEKSDRRDLDLIVLAGLGLTGLAAVSLLAEVYTALTRLVAERLERSRRTAPGAEER